MDTSSADNIILIFVYGSWGSELQATADTMEEAHKKAKEASEHTRIALRNVRRDANKKVDHEEKDSLLTEDEAKKGRDDVQDLLKKYEGTIDTLLAAKTKDIMSV